MATSKGVRLLPGAAPSVLRLYAFHRDELVALMALRTRYESSHDLFDDREWGRLCFLRWLVETGRITP